MFSLLAASREEKDGEKVRWAGAPGPVLVLESEGP